MYLSDEARTRNAAFARESPEHAGCGCLETPGSAEANEYDHRDEGGGCGEGISYFDEDRDDGEGEGCAKFEDLIDGSAE